MAGKSIVSVLNPLFGLRLYQCPTEMASSTITKAIAANYGQENIRLKVTVRRNDGKSWPLIFNELVPKTEYLPEQKLTTVLPLGGVIIQPGESIWVKADGETAGELAKLQALIPGYPWHCSLTTVYQFESVQKAVSKLGAIHISIYEEEI